MVSITKTFGLLYGRSNSWQMFQLFLILSVIVLKYIFNTLLDVFLYLFFDIHYPICINQQPAVYFMLKALWMCNLIFIVSFGRHHMQMQGSNPDLCSSLDHPYYSNMRMTDKNWDNNVNGKQLKRRENKTTHMRNTMTKQAMIKIGTDPVTPDIYTPGWKDGYKWSLYCVCLESMANRFKTCINENNS